MGEDKKKHEQSEKTENIIALSVFAVLILVVLGLFTNGFGFFGPKELDPTQRVPIAVENDPIRGTPEGAGVAIIIFSDFECPFCKKGEDIVNSIFQKYQGDVILIFKNFPLTNIHKNAFGAALAAECAKEQGKFWEYHDYLFAHNTALTIPDLKNYAKELGLDEAGFNECLDSQRYAASVNRDVLVGKEAGVSGTPTFFINGIPLVGAVPQTDFVKIIESELSLSKN